MSSTLREETNEWIVDLTVMITESMPGGIFTVVPSWNPQEAIPCTMEGSSMPGGVRFLFDIDSRMLAGTITGREPGRAQSDAESDFWNQQLPDALAVLTDRKDAQDCAFRAYSKTECTSVEWSDNLTVSQSVFQNVMRQAIGCLLFQPSSRQTLRSELTLDKLEPNLGGEPVLWLIIRWSSEDTKLFDTVLGSDDVNDMLADLASDYNLGSSLGNSDRVLILMLHRFSDGGTLGQSDLANNLLRVRKAMEDKGYGGRILLHSLAVNAADHDLTDSLVSALHQLNSYNPIHLSFPVGIVMAEKQSESATLRLAYPASESDRCSGDTADDIPFPRNPGGWDGSSAHRPFLFYVPWIIGACLVIAVGLWLSLLLFTHSSSFRSHLSDELGLVFPWYHDYLER